MIILNVKVSSRWKYKFSWEFEVMGYAFDAADINTCVLKLMYKDVQSNS